MASNRRVFLLCALLVPVATWCGDARAESAQTQPTRLPRPVPEIERAILISIDGCRPDVLLRARTPNVRSLMEQGSYTFWATTVPVAVTLPAHASMITGVLPEKHGITWNNQVGEDAEVTHPKVPTIFEIAMRYGMSTALVAGKSKFDTFARVGHVGKAWTQAATDDKVGEAAIAMLRDYRPELLMVHFPGADKAGHAVGFATPKQVEMLEGIDVQIGKIVDTLEDLGLRDNTVILITSDHGGQGRGHGISSGSTAPPDDPRSQHIPWILSGPGIRKNYDLSQDPRLHVRTMDTFATLCHLLGLQPDGEIDGKPVTLAIEAPQQLLQDAK
jgi:hypothetical protein